MFSDWSAFQADKIKVNAKTNNYTHISKSNNKMSMDVASDINFFKGHPSYRLLPNKAILDATTQLLTPSVRDYDSDTHNRHPLTYGSDEGSLWVREEISSFNNEQVFKFAEGSRCRSSPEYINLNSGASYGVLSILMQSTLAHTSYTKQAFIITPTYFLINDCFIDAGFGGKLTAIDEKGPDSIDFDKLMNKLEELEHTPTDSSKLDSVVNPEKEIKKKIYRYVLYCVPTFSNPSGSTYSYETRMRLIEIARKYDMLIIADDVYDLLNYTQPINKLPTPPKRFVHLDRETTEDNESYGNTISNATFSKLLAPGLRFGYHESINSKLVLQLSKGGANTSGGTPSQLNSMIVGTMIKNGSLTDIIMLLRETYSQRSKTMFEAMQIYLPSKTEFKLLDGGYFTWVTLPEGYNAHEICTTLRTRYGVLLANGSEFEVIGDKRNWGNRSIRISISFLELTEIEKGIQIIGKVCKQYSQAAGLPW